MDALTLRAVLGIDTTQYEQGLKSATGMASSIGGKIGGGLAKAAKVGAAALGAATTAVVAFGKKAIDAGGQFDTSMSQVAATMGKTMDEMQNEVGEVDLAWGTFSGNLREYAQEMGAHTAFSASQAADALNYMALAGYDTQTSMQMLPNVLNLAAAGSMELATASDMVTDAQSALNLSLDETELMVDQMAKTSSKTNTSVSQLGEAMLTIGATARGVKGGTVELSQVLGVLADNGIKGAEGGTHLRNAILSLQTPTKAGSIALEQLGMSYRDMYDEAGNMRALPEIFMEMQTRMEGMTQASKDAIISGVFNKTDLAAVNALIGTTSDRWAELDTEIRGAWFTDASIQKAFDNNGLSMETMKERLGALGISAEAFSESLKQSQGDADLFADMLWESADKGVEFEDVVQALGGDLDTLGVAFSETTGAAQAMADTQLDNLQGDITLFKSALEGAQIAISDQLMPSLRDFVQFGSDGLSRLTDAFKADGLSGAMAELGNIISEGLNLIITKLPEAVTAGAQLLGAIVQGIVENLPTLLDAAMQIIMMLVEDVSANAGQMADSATEIIMQLLQYLIENAPKLIKAAADMILKLAQGLSQNIPTLLPTIVEVVLAIVTALIDNAPQLFESSLQIIFALAEGLIKALPKLLAQAPIIVAKLVSSIIQNAFQLASAALELIVKLATELANNFPKILEKGKEAVKKMIEGIKAEFGEVVTSGKNLIDKFIEGIKALFDAVKSIGSKVVDMAKDGIMGAVSNAAEWGSHLIENFIDGIKEGWETLKGGVVGIGKKIAGVFKHSKPEPDSPFYGEENWFPHMFENMAESIRASRHILMDELDGTFGDIGADIEASGTGGGRGVSVVQNIYSKAQTASELMREAKYEQERAVLMGV